MEPYLGSESTDWIADPQRTSQFTEGKLILQMMPLWSGDAKWLTKMKALISISHCFGCFQTLKWGEHGLQDTDVPTSAPHLSTLFHINTAERNHEIRRLHLKYLRALWPLDSSLNSRSNRSPNYKMRRIVHINQTGREQRLNSVI